QSSAGRHAGVGGVWISTGGGYFDAVSLLRASRFFGDGRGLRARGRGFADAVAGGHDHVERVTDVAFHRFIARARRARDVRGAVLLPLVAIADRGGSRPHAVARR